MNERIGDSLATEYKIFKDNGLSPVDGYIVSREIKDEVANVFRRNATANRVKMSKEEARLTVDQVIKNVKLDPTTGRPFFKYPGIGMNADQALITKSIAKNINNEINKNSDTHIYMAFAEFPFVSSNSKAGVAR